MACAVLSKEQKKIKNRELSLEGVVLGLDIQRRSLMRAILLAAILLYTTPAFAGVQFQEAPKIDSEQQQIDNDLKEAKKKNKEGLALLKQKKYTEAGEAFFLATTLDPDNADFHNNYGASLLKLDDAMSAVSEFEFATELGLDTASVWNNLGKAYESTNRMKEARDAYLKALRLGSTSAGKSYQRVKTFAALTTEQPFVFVGGLGCGGPTSMSADVGKALSNSPEAPTEQNPPAK
jgi:tetratricopeptide (TPR) repeat protein